MISSNIVSDLSFALLFILLTLVVYQAFIYLQKECKQSWLNPMLFSILTLIPILLLFNVPFEQYYQASPLWLH